MDQTYDFRPSWQRMADYKKPIQYSFDSSSAVKDLIGAKKEGSDSPFNLATSKAGTDSPFNLATTNIRSKSSQNRKETEKSSGDNSKGGDSQPPQPSLPKIDLSNFGKVVAAGCLLLYAYKSLKDEGVNVELQPGTSTRRSLFVWVDVAIAAVIFIYLVRYSITII